LEVLTQQHEQRSGPSFYLFNPASKPTPAPHSLLLFALILKPLIAPVSTALSFLQTVLLMRKVGYQMHIEGSSGSVPAIENSPALKI